MPRDYQRAFALHHGHRLRDEARPLLLENAGRLGDLLGHPRIRCVHRVVRFVASARCSRANTKKSRRGKSPQASATSAPSSTSLPTKPGCPLIGRPTTSKTILTWIDWMDSSRLPPGTQPPIVPAPTGHSSAVLTTSRDARARPGRRRSKRPSKSAGRRRREAARGHEVNGPTTPTGSRWGRQSWSAAPGRLRTVETAS
jgi:hypothetical protein